MPDCFIKDTTLTALADAMRSGFNVPSSTKYYPRQIAYELRVDFANIQR